MRSSPGASVHAVNSPTSKRAPLFITTRGERAVNVTSERHERWGEPQPEGGEPAAPLPPAATPFFSQRAGPDSQKEKRA
ncbi:hypothetical protein SKAU_G00242620 [Synaphobranchus kaupii]|uniref:Uncharacterized protein n=1 Tax=Synaphobranchus kaupii TaxID=118154 RepID=A0A9Q1F7T1_SYNKA|nr:hypothetical protein SKAU_G00242620 [Synaphobranchus kaupii]